MPANHAPVSRASSVASADTTTSSQSQSQYHNNNNNNAALQGAALAFGRQPPKPRAPPTTTNMTPARRGTGNNHRALAAATTPGRPDSRASLAPPQGGSDDSHQAAVLAAARAKPSVAIDPAHRERQGKGTQTMRPSHRPAVGPKPRRYSEHRDTSTVDKPTDTTSIAPTTSLVDMFEQRSRTTTSDTPVKGPDPLVYKPSKDLPMNNPKPVRSGGVTSMIQLELEARVKGEEAMDHVDPGKEDSGLADRYDGQGHSSEDSFASASESLHGGSRLRAHVRTKVAARSPSHGDLLRSQNDAKRRPQTSPAPQHVAGSARPVPTKQHQQMAPPPRPMSAQSTGRSASSVQSHLSIPAQYNAAHPRKMTPLRSGDDLANAIVASSLVLSGAPSPTRLEPPPVPSRRRKGQHHKLSFSRSSSPVKTGMLHTLRKQDDGSSSESEDQHPYHKHHKKRLVRKHPNKHHEGDRKRWRDAVTERERKRYEGVWAANKGIHCSFTLEEQEFFLEQPSHERTLEAKAAVKDTVSNIVARDIWSRSRLPAFVLELVWDLVDTKRSGRLSKEEFVVGLWLIDQRLKGRKLPTKVSESVWASVKGFKLRGKR